MKIGLLGFGTVGKGVYDITTTINGVEITRVLCLEDINLEAAQSAKSFDEILNDDTIDTIVEVMGGLHPAWEYVKSAIEKGKNVVTANKALVNNYYDEILALTKQYGTKFRCTAAVGGGIGWLTELERAKRVDTVTKVGGIMNGTCNYILDSMTTKRIDYDVALKQAQQLGYAEADPSADVDGIDTWNKIIISANIAFDVSVDKDTVPVCGISNITADDIAQLSNHGYICKLMGTAQNDENGITVCVQPTLVKQGEPAAAVPANYNHISMTGTNSGMRSLFGQGAGRYPTAYNVVQDCIDVHNGVGFYTDKAEKVKADNTICCRYYVRGAQDEWLSKNAEEKWGEAVITKPVQICKIHSWLAQHKNVFIAAMD